MVKDIDIFFNIAITVNTLSKVLAMNTEGAVHIFVIYQPPCELTFLKHLTCTAMLVIKVLETLCTCFVRFNMHV